MRVDPRAMAHLTVAVPLLLATSGLASAQGSAPTPAPAPTVVAPVAPSPQPGTQPGTSATVIDLSSIQSVIGKGVKSYAGEDMGRIVDVLVTSSGQPRAAVIDFGGLLGVGSRKVAVDWKTLDFSKSAKDGVATLDLTRNEVRVSPEYKSGDPVVVLEATKTGKQVAPPAPDHAPSAEISSPDK